MYGPKVRFALTMSFIVIMYWIWNVSNKYLFGDAGVNFALYSNGIITLGLAALGGFVFVWVAVRFITFQHFRKTGFEETTTDEYGTTFNWAISLSKFLPDIIAPPYIPNISPQEQEIMGFLNGYRHWPHDINNPKAGTLHSTAMARWHTVRQFDGATHMHCIMALAIDLGKVHAYAEKRTSFSKPWKRDKITFTQQSAEHGSLSAFILSTFQTFRTMSDDERQDLLLAVRYGRDHHRMPKNTTPLVRHMYKTLHKAEGQLAKKAAQQTQNTPDTLPPEALTELKREINTYAQGVMSRISLANDGGTDGLFIGGKNPILALSMPAFTQRLAQLLQPELRHQLHMWDMAKTPHPTWPTIIETLKDTGCLIETFDGTDPAENGLFSLSFGGQTHPHCLLITPTPTIFPNLNKHLLALPPYPGSLEPAQDDTALLADIKAKAMNVDSLLQ